MRVIGVVLAILAFANAAHAQYVGLSAFGSGATHSLEAREPFACNKYLAIAVRPRYPAMSILPGTFGDDLWCPLWFMAALSERAHLVQVHFSNESGRKKHNLGAGEFLPHLSVDAYSRALEQGDPVVAAAVVARVQGLAAFFKMFANENTAIILSLGLEDKLTSAAAAKLTALIRPHWPYGINRNPLGSTRYLAGADYFEKHGDAKCDGLISIVNQDGAVRSLKQTRKWLAKNASCLVRLVWRPEHQGRTASGKSVYPRRARRFHISDRDVIELGDLLSNY